VTYVVYKLELAACHRKGLRERRLDVIVDGSYAEMFVLSGDPSEMLYRAAEGSHLEFELFEITNIEELVDCRVLMAGEEPMNSLGTNLHVTLTDERVDFDPIDDVLRTLDNLDEDDLDEGWPKLEPNVFAAESDDNDQLIGALI
jgi:hypothetical protein